jgi:LmbE family N-acetylglucosaminyl deacetylase
MGNFEKVTLPGGGKPVLLTVMAHPDDETFGMGGTLAMYARRGVEVYLACATRGEVGDVSPELLKGFNSVAELRESELRCAAGLLQLTDIFFLDYRDSGMPGSPDNVHPMALANTPQDEVVAKVVHIIRMLKPQVVLTFDPIGGYRHPDHIAIHKATVAAFYAAGKADYHPEDLPAYQPQKLYFQTMPKRALRIAVRLMPLLGRDPHRFGRNGDIDLVSITSEEFPTHARIDYTPVAEIRAQAAACHSSQGGGQMAKGIQGWVMRLGGQSEAFMRAYPPPVKGKRESDLFAGVSSV